MKQPLDDRSTKGILRAGMGKTKYNLIRFAPAEELRLYIQHYWVAEWDLRGQEPYPQAVLSHPNVNLVFEPGKVLVYGIWEKTSTQLLQGKGSVFAVKFLPAGFYPFWKQPLSELTGRTMGLDEVFGEEADSIEKEILNARNPLEQVERIDRFFIDRKPDPDANVKLLNDMVAALVANTDIVRVEQLARFYGISVRTLQRLFNRYIGVSPKAVIKRFRLHEAAEKMEKGEFQDLAKLSVDLGYYDQAHFIKDFKSILGKSPDEYLRSGT